MIEMKQVLKVLIGIGFLTVACCVLYAENESNDDARVNANLGGILSLPLHPTEHFATIGGGAVGGAGHNVTRKHAVLGEFIFNRLSGTDAVVGGITASTTFPSYSQYRLD